MNRDKYEYKGNTYWVESIGEMKNSTTRKWETCYIYISDSNGNRYVRNADEFNELFKLVE